MDKTCPLNMIGNSSGLTIACPGARCMFWDAENVTCVLFLFYRSMLDDECYDPPTPTQNEDVT